MKHLFYEDWANKRIKAITDWYGKDWFWQKKILELGCAHGDIGTALLKLGADVTFSDAREDRLKEITEDLVSKYDFKPKTCFINNNTPWVYNEKVDLILHLGLLYHLEHWKEDIANCFAYTDNMILETVIKPNEDYYNNTYHKVYGSYKCLAASFTQKEVEEHLDSLGYNYYIIPVENSKGLIDADTFIRHVYSWNEELKPHPNIITHYRKMWYITKKIL
jgi:hypothetical protein